MLKFRTPFSFFLAICLLFTSLIPVSAATTPKKLWQFEFDGEPLFDPVLTKNEEIFVGKYSIINSVYHNDFMTIDNSNGNVIKEWNIEGKSKVLTDKQGKVYVTIFDDENNILSIYSEEGKLLWDTPLESEADYLYIEKENNLIRVQNNYSSEIIYFSFEGREISREEVDYWGIDEEQYYIEILDRDQISLIKKDENWSDVFRKDVHIPIPSNLRVGDFDIVPTEYNTLFVILSLVDNDYDSYQNKGYRLLVFDLDGNQLSNVIDIGESGEYQGYMYADKNLHLLIEGNYLTISDKGEILNKNRIFNDSYHHVRLVEKIDGQYLYFLFYDAAMLTTLDGKIVWKKDLPVHEYEYLGWDLYDIIEDEIFSKSYSDIESWDKLTGETNWQYHLTTEGSLAALLIDNENKKIYFQTRKVEDINTGNPDDIEYKRTTILGAIDFNEFQQGPETTYPADKMWTVTFNHNIDEASVDSNSIYVVDSNGTRVEGLKYAVNENKVMVYPPDEGYTSGVSYNLIVTKNVKSVSQKNLKSETYKEFRIK